jgi:hypothetical protein
VSEPAQCNGYPWNSSNIDTSRIYSQLGLGAELAFPIIPVPTEVSLPRRLRCLGIRAGGHSTYFVTEHSDDNHVDLLASGHGQYGCNGNGLWANQTTPVRVKSVSGLWECL